MKEQEDRVDARQLYERLLDHTGPDAYGTVVEPWLGRAVGEYRTELVEGVGRLERWAADGPDERGQELLWELYALSRVSDAILLAFQPPGDPDEPWSPALTAAQYLELFGRLGMTSFERAGAFDPFWHEIVEVEQSPDPDEPIQVTDVVWPGLTLGTMLFGRAGVRVRAGVRHAERGMADRSPLYWTHRRRHRPTEDQSKGWGHNSQWRTDFRVDLCTGTGYELNAGAHGDGDDLDGLTYRRVTPGEQRELLRHRCLLRTPADAAELDETAPGWREDLYPYPARLSLNRA